MFSIVRPKVRDCLTWLRNVDRRSAFDIDNRRGQLGENLVGTFVEALADSRLEVKTDFRAGETGNVYIETHQRLFAGDLVQSGINVSEAEFYCLAGPKQNGFIVLKTDVLRQLAINSPGRTIAHGNINSNPTNGRIVSLRDILGEIF